MGTAGGVFTLFYGILALIIIVLGLFMPIFVYQIRNRCLNMDKKMGTIIDLLGGPGAKKSTLAKICPFCGADNLLTDQVCRKCGKAMGL